MSTPNYATVSEVKTFKVNGVVALPALLYSDGEIEAEINLMEEWIEKITGDIFYSKTATYKFDSFGKDCLFFPPRVSYSLLSITTCKEVDTDGTVLDTLVEGQDFIKFPHHLEVVRNFPEDSPRRWFRGGIFPSGQLSIQVEGTWGATTCPLAIKRAVILLTLERLKKGSTKMTPGEVSSVQWPDFSVSFRQAGGDGQSYLGKNTGFVEVDRLLSDYINYAGLFLPVDGHRPRINL